MRILHIKGFRNKINTLFQLLLSNSLVYVLQSLEDNQLTYDPEYVFNDVRVSAKYAVHYKWRFFVLINDLHSVM